MKFVKFGALALALGMFAASCNEETETVKTDKDTTVIVEPVAITPPVEVPMTPDTVTAPVVVEPAPAQ